MTRTIRISFSQRTQLAAAFLAGLDHPDNAICCGKNAVSILASIVGDRDAAPLYEWCYGALGCQPSGRGPMDPGKRAHYLAKIDALTELSAETEDERAVSLDGN